MHLMVDFETLGTRPGTAVLSVGCVAYDRDGIHSKALWEFSIPEQLALKRSMSGETLIWWARQSDSARKVFEDNDFKVTVDQFFTAFDKFIDLALKAKGQNREQLNVWGNGANFDISIFEDLYWEHHENQGKAIPWKFFNVYCFRTFNFLTKCRDLVPKKQTHGVKHNALDDAIHQTECMLAFWNKGKKPQ